MCHGLWEFLESDRCFRNSGGDQQSRTLRVTWRQVSSASTANPKADHHGHTQHAPRMVIWANASMEGEMRVLTRIIVAFIVFSPVTVAAQTNWQTKLKQELPLLGDRNWIAVVDSAYPLQVSPGAETIETNANAATVVRTVLSDIAHARHVRPVVYMDAELPYVSEKDAPGIDAYRKNIHEALGNLPVHYLLHAKRIAQLNSTAKIFKVLILKTTLTVPYSSVFIHLKCGYWSDGAEIRLRKAMKAGTRAGGAGS